jgi:hypothetical protein
MDERLRKELTTVVLERAEREHLMIRSGDLEAVVRKQHRQVTRKNILPRNELNESFSRQAALQPINIPRTGALQSLLSRHGDRRTQFRRPSLQCCAKTGLNLSMSASA